MQGDFEAFYLRHFKAIYRVCYAFMKKRAGRRGLHGGYLRQGHDE